MRTSILLILIGIFADSYGAGTTTHILADPRNDTRDTAAIGLSGTFGNYASPGGEVYFKRNIRVFKQSTELKLGLNYRTYDIELDDVTGLNVGSVGLFADLTWFPFRSNGLFGGIRWEGINLNWLSDESREKYRQETGNTFSTLYSGTNGYLQAGYQFRLGNTLRLRLYGQPGIQQFRTGAIGSYASDPSTSPTNYVLFVYNVNMGLEFRIK